MLWEHFAFGFAVGPRVAVGGDKKIIQVLEEKRKVARSRPDKAGRDQEEPFVSLRDATNCCRRFKVPLKFPKVGTRINIQLPNSDSNQIFLLSDKGRRGDLSVLHPQGSVGQSDGEHGQKDLNV